MGLIVVNSHNPLWGLCSIIDNSNSRNAIVEELGKNKIVRHYSPYGQLNEIRVKEGDKIRLIDCPVCNNKDIPISFKETMIKGNKTIDIYECSICGKIPNIIDNIKVKAYVDFESKKN